MAIYIVTYDLRNESTSDSYTRLISLIKEEGVWACLGGSSYLVDSELTPVALRDKYKQALDHDDKLFVKSESLSLSSLNLASNVDLSYVLLVLFESIICVNVCVQLKGTPCECSLIIICFYYYAA